MEAIFKILKQPPLIHCRNRSGIVNREGTFLRETSGVKGRNVYSNELARDGGEKTCPLRRQHSCLVTQKNPASRYNHADSPSEQPRHLN